MTRHGRAGGGQINGRRQDTQRIARRGARTHSRGKSVPGDPPRWPGSGHTHLQFQAGNYRRNFRHHDPSPRPQAWAAQGVGPYPPAKAGASLRPFCLPGSPFPFFSLSSVGGGTLKGGEGASSPPGQPRMTPMACLCTPVPTAVIPVFIRILSPSSRRLRSHREVPRLLFLGWLSLLWPLFRPPSAPPLSLTRHLAALAKAAGKAGAYWVLCSFLIEVPETRPVQGRFAN
ncbi:hypothetical protein GQ53DRAFT_343734 [Thozetella sp. PMI_491]|nr:hypothetical protein GQ53DRAFT_343734 [Thozetella sp. PMI_491]